MAESSFPEADLKPEYWAFISYRHLNNQQTGRQWANWLHQLLESYDVPEELVGKENELGVEIPDRIYPVFRDEEDLPADADLANSIRSAVERSKYMIVICSPRSAESTYVAEEIAYFKKLGRENRILALMIEGEPNASWDEGKQKAGFSRYQECFPRPLIHPVTNEGKLDSSNLSEPIAADLRLQPGGRQGWTTPAAYREALQAQGSLRKKAITEAGCQLRKTIQTGAHKILAGVLGVPLRILTQKEKDISVLQRPTAPPLVDDCSGKPAPRTVAQRLPLVARSNNVKPQMLIMDFASIRTPRFHLSADKAAHKSFPPFEFQLSPS